MLVLTRHRHESIMIGREIQMTVVAIQGDKVRLGFEAPESVQIYRREIYDEILRENLQAAQLQPSDVSGIVAAQPPPMKIATQETEMDPFLRAAIDQAKQGLSEGGLPIGSVLVRGDQIIGRGHNRRVQRGDPMAHAEIDCLTNAGRQKTYKDTILYSTLMPCYLCTGAVLQFGIPKVIVGESATFPGGEGKWGKSPDFLSANGVEVIDLHDSECIEMMSQFIRENPRLWNEDIGVD